jgi:hypothetical protein
LSVETKAVEALRRNGVTFDASGFIMSDPQMTTDEVPRPRYTPTDRMLLAMLAKLPPRDRRPVFLVTPSTLLRWHRQLVARRWTYPHTGATRRGLDDTVVEFVLRLARENPRWGYLRIVDACQQIVRAEAHRKWFVSND